MARWPQEMARLERGEERAKPHGELRHVPILERAAGPSRVRTPAADQSENLVVTDKTIMMAAMKGVSFIMRQNFSECGRPP